MLGHWASGTSPRPLPEEASPIWFSRGRWPKQSLSSLPEPGPASRATLQAPNLRSALRKAEVCLQGLEAISSLGLEAVAGTSTVTLSKSFPSESKVTWRKKHKGKQGLSLLPLLLLAGLRNGESAVQGPGKQSWNPTKF